MNLRPISQLDVNIGCKKSGTSFVASDISNGVPSNFVSELDGAISHPKLLRQSSGMPWPCQYKAHLSLLIMSHVARSKSCNKLKTKSKLQFVSEME